MAEVEKAKGNPRIEIPVISVRLKKSLIKVVNRFDRAKKRVKEKARIIFKVTAETVIKVGVLVSCQEKKARRKRGIKDWAKIETEKIAKQAEVNSISSKPNFPVL